MKKIKQILALLGVILLVGLYVATLVCAVLDRSETMSMFRASLFATVVVPVLLWIYIFIYRLITKNDRDDKDSQ
jgi:fucose permease